MNDITEQKRMHQQALCAQPTDVLAKVIVVAGKASEDNSYSTIKGVICLLSKVRLGDPTPCELLCYLGSLFGKMED